MAGFWENDPVAPQQSRTTPAPVFTAPDPAGEEERERKRRDQALQEEKAQRDREEFEGTAGKPTETQGKAAAFLIRALGANAGYERTGEGARNIFAQAFQDSSPNLANSLINADSRQVANAAQDEFIAASLRMDSGAAIPPEEIESQRRIYFPMPGDSPEAIELKRQARLRAIEGLRMLAGPLRADAESRFAALEAEFADGTRTPTTQQVMAELQPPREEGQAREVEMRGGLPVGTEIQWDIDNPETAFDRTAYLQRQYGITPNQEALISGFWNAQRGNQALTPDAVKQWYQGQGLPLPTDDDIAAAITDARTGQQFGGLDTSAAEEAYVRELDAALEARGADPESLTGTIGAKAAQGIMWGGLDEIAGAGGFTGELFRGGNPVAGYQAERDLIRREQERAGAANPGTALTSELIGGLTTGGAGARSVRTIGDAARLGAVTGGVAGFNYGEGTAGSLGGAVAGAAAGTVLGAGGAKTVEAMAARRAARQAAAPRPSPPPANDFTVSGSVQQGGGRAAPDAQLSAAEQTEIAGLARKATGSGAGARAARQDLARRAAVNPEARAAADRIGVELPPDILSDDAQLQSLAGLTRSQVGSEAETAWRGTSARVSEQADSALEAIGGNRDLAQISDDVFRRLDSTAQALENQASALRREVDAAIRPGERVDATNLQRVVAKLINDYGGLSEAKAAMTAQEKSLLTMLGEGEEAIRPTYARLNRLRDDIGEALSKGKGPWADVNRKQLGEYYRALADDQLAAIEQLGGAELAEKQRTANTLFKQMFDQRAEMQGLFGKGLEKSLAPLLRRAVTGGTKGDTKDLTFALERIPASVRGPALVSAILAQSRSNAYHGGFSFANYAKIYRGLRENSPVYAKIGKAVGKEGERVLRDLYVISNRMAQGETRVLKTGKANQVLSSAIQAESLVGNILGSVLGRGTTAAATAAGGAVAGPGGAVAGATIANTAKQSIVGGGRSRLDKVHNLLSSPQFQSLMNRIANGDPADASEAIWSIPAFHKLAKASGYASPEARRAWLNQIVSSQSVRTANAAGLPRQVTGALNDNVAPLAAQSSDEEK